MSKSDLSVRESLVMSARARALLERLIDYFALWGPKNKHFKGSHASQEVLALRAGIDEQVGRDVHHDRLVTQLSGTLHRSPLPQFHIKMARFLLGTAYSILEHLAKGKPVPNSDLDELTQVLREYSYSNPIRYCKTTDPLQKHYRSQEPIACELAQDLLEYMNLCARYGPEHAICELQSCGSLMITGRGGKKFCSAECRKAYWNYDRQKDYYIEKRRESRESLGAVRKKRNKEKRTGRSV
jgi:hypothetical protein